MKVHHLNNLEPRPFNKAVLTIGTFDGVHIGHKKILDRVKSEAERIGGESVLITFHPHPRNVLRPEGPAIELLNTIDEKIELLDGIGIDHLIIVPFTPAFSRLTARQYVEDFIIQKFHPHTLIIGYDHHFGSGRTGNFQLLESYREKGAFHLLEIEAALLRESQVSSTRIREALHKGEVEEAAAEVEQLIDESKVTHEAKAAETAAQAAEETAAEAAEEAAGDAVAEAADEA